MAASKQYQGVGMSCNLGRRRRQARYLDTQLTELFTVGVMQGQDWRPRLTAPLSSVPSLSGSSHPNPSPDHIPTQETPTLRTKYHGVCLQLTKSQCLRRTKWKETWGLIWKLESRIIQRLSLAQLTGDLKLEERRVLRKLKIKLKFKCFRMLAKIGDPMERSETSIMRINAKPSAHGERHH